MQLQRFRGNNLTIPLPDTLYQIGVNAMVRLTGFEPTTSRVGVWHSIQLSYSRIYRSTPGGGNLLFSKQWSNSSQKKRGNWPGNPRSQWYQGFPAYLYRNGLKRRSLALYPAELQPHVPSVFTRGAKSAILVGGKACRAPAALRRQGVL